MSILYLPSETITHVLQDMCEIDHHRDLRGVLGTCHRLNAIARPIAYQSVALFQPKPREGTDDTEPAPHHALDQHGLLFQLQPDIGRHIHRLSFQATSTDLLPSVANCSLINERAIVRFCRNTPFLTHLELNACFWSDSAGAVPLHTFPTLSSLRTTHATLCGADPFPQSVLRHFPNITRFAMSTAPGTVVDPSLVSALRREIIPLVSLIVEPSFPIPTDLVEALLEAGAPTLRFLTLYLPLVACPPSFDIPEEMFLDAATELEELTLIYPLAMFPLDFEIRDTWHYSAILIMSAAAGMRKLTIGFDTGKLSAHQALRRLDALQPYLLEAVFDELDPQLVVSIEFHTPSSLTAPTWDAVRARNPGWDSLAQRANVSFSIKALDAASPSFALPGTLRLPAALADEAFLAWYASELSWDALNEVSIIRAAPASLHTHDSRPSCTWTPPSWRKSNERKRGRAIPHSAQHAV